jgi:hypothetical protein
MVFINCKLRNQHDFLVIEEFYENEVVMSNGEHEYIPINLIDTIVFSQFKEKQPNGADLMVVRDIKILIEALYRSFTRYVKKKYSIN